MWRSLFVVFVVLCGCGLGTTPQPCAQLVTPTSHWIVRTPGVLERLP